MEYYKKCIYWTIDNKKITLEWVTDVHELNGHLIVEYYTTRGAKKRFIPMSYVTKYTVKNDYKHQKF